MTERPDDQAPFDDDVRQLLAERGRTTDGDVRGIVEGIARLPGRPRGRVRSFLAAAAGVGILVGAGVLLFGRFANVGPAGPRPPDPAAFADDPRLATCRSQLTDVDRVFEMTRARWFPLYFPGWWKGAPELEVDDPALVVIEKARQWGITGAPAAQPTDGSSPGPMPTQPPAFRMCIAVGPPGSAIVHQYGPTWFDRIVPVLSDVDVARAAHMDPDVLADPSTFSDPGRLVPCGGLSANVLYVFEATPLRDFPRYFPRVAPSPVAAFDVDDSATVVVFRGPSGLNIQPLTVHQDNQTGDRHDVCVIFSQPSAAAKAVLIRDLDITGFHVRLEEPAPSEPSVTPPPVGSPTPEPAPSWVADLAGQLQCSGPVASLGGEVPDGGSPETRGATAEEALSVFLGPGNPYASLPAAGFQQLRAEAHWASFGHLVDQKAKAIIVLSDISAYGPGWMVVGLRACDASEFDPSVPLTFPVTIWTDKSGARVSTETIRSIPGPGHCGWDSATWLSIDRQVYFRDPKRVMAEWTRTKFGPVGQLPPRAIDSGYRTGNWALWLDPGHDAYLVMPGRIERWPRSTDPLIGCM